MQTVVHIVNGEVVRAEVPTDWILCSVSGEYRPPEEYCKQGEQHQSRTNCTRTYLMPSKDSALLSESVKKLGPALKKMKAELHHEMQEKKAGMPIADYITMLQEIAASNPNARIVCVDDGYIDVPCVQLLDGYKNLYS